MKLSIIIPYYNKEPYTSELLDAIRHLKQSDKEFVKEMLEQFEKEQTAEGKE